VLFTFPSRYLFTIGHQEYLALESGLPRFPRDFSCPVVLKNTGQEPVLFRYGTITLYGGPFQGPSTRVRFVTPGLILLSPARSYNPGKCIGLQATKHTVWALPRSFATTRGIVFLFLGVLRCFTSPAYLTWPMCSARGIRFDLGVSCLIRESPAKFARQLTEAYRSLATPFFGS
jgi:hypothetical protein